MNIEFIKKYRSELYEAIVRGNNTFFQNANEIYSIIRRCITVIGKDIDINENMFSWKKILVDEDSQILLDILDYHLTTSNSKSQSEIKDTVDKKLIFISHKSDDCKYGNALRDFIIGLGVKDDELIYTSHSLHKIPLDEDIYDYLRNNINSNIFMIILWSDKYLESPACLNEMGAAWVAQSDYTNVYVPNFSFGNPKYHECAVDTRKMGAVLNGDEHCKTSMIELKNKITSMFNLEVDEKKTAYLIDKFIEEITK